MPGISGESPSRQWPASHPRANPRAGLKLETFRRIRIELVLQHMTAGYAGISQSHFLLLRPGENPVPMPIQFLYAEMKHVMIMVLI